MGSAADDRWVLSAIGALVTAATVTLLIVRPVPLPPWLPGAALTSSARTTGTSRDLGLPQPFTVTPGDRKITVMWRSADGMDRYRVEVTNVADTPTTPATLPCRRITTGVANTSGCVISDVRNGADHLVTVRPADESGSSPPPRIVRVVPRPASLGLGSTVLWLDAGDYATMRPEHAGPVWIGSRVAELRDKSLRRLRATQPDSARRPIVGQLGRLPALVFAGGGILSVSGGSLPAGGSPSTVFVVAAQDDPSPEVTCFHTLLAWGARQTGGARALHKGCRTSLAFADTYGTHTAQRPTQAWSIGQAAVMSAVFDGTGTAVRLNGIPSYRWEATSSWEVDTIATGDAHLGCANWDLTAGWIGRIGEAIVFDRVLPPEELVTVEKYLGTRWQVPPLAVRE